MDNKIPFEPEDSDVYWTYVGIEGVGWDVYDEIWDGSPYDYIHKAAGCVFRTKEEALEYLPVKYKMLTGRDWGR